MKALKNHYKLILGILVLLVLQIQVMEAALQPLLFCVKACYNEQIFQIYNQGSSPSFPFKIIKK